MLTRLANYNVFLASPVDLQEERAAFRQTLFNYNDFHGINKGIQFKPVGCEPALSNHDGPQDNRISDIKKCHYFIMVLHDSLEFNPDAEDGVSFTAGMNAAFQEALDCLANDESPMRQVIIFFRDVYSSQLADKGPRLLQLLAFRENREKKKDFIYKTYNSIEAFVHILEASLACWAGDKASTPGEDLTFLSEHPASPVKSFYKENYYAWLKKTFSTDNWDVALDEADKMFKEQKTGQAESIYFEASRCSSNPMHIARYGKLKRKMYSLYIAEDILKKSIEMADVLNDPLSRAYGFRQLGRVYEYSGAFEKALDKYKEALSIYKSLKNIHGEAKAIMDIGFVLNRSYRPNESMVKMNIALELFKKFSDLSGQGECLGHIGYIYMEKGNFKKAQEYYERALCLLEKNKEENGAAIAIVTGNMGVLYRIQGNADRAEKLHNQALIFYNNHYDLRARASQLSNLGAVYQENKDWDRALGMHKCALELEKQTMNEKGKGIELGNIGLIMMEMGNLVSAEVYFRESMEISRKLFDAKGQSCQYKNLARLYNQMGNTDEALLNVTRSRLLDEKDNDLLEFAKGLKIRGEILIALPDKIPDARVYFEDAKKIFLLLGLANYANKIDARLSKMRLSAA